MATMLKLLGLWLKFADLTEVPKKGRWARRLYYLALPLTLLVDTALFVWCWRVVILGGLLTREPAVKFFDDNEFGYRWWKLYKMDVIEPDSFLDKMSVDELKIQVQREMTTSILRTIKENTVFDIEEYVTLICETWIDPDSKLKVYGVTMQYYRWHLIRRNWLLRLPLWAAAAATVWLAAERASAILPQIYHSFAGR